MNVCVAGVTQHVPEPVSHEVQVTNHLQSSSGAGPFRESGSLSHSVLYSSLFSHSFHHVTPFFQSSLSIKCCIDSPDSSHSYRSPFLSFSVQSFSLVPHFSFWFLSLWLSLLSLLLFMCLSLWSRLSIHVLSPTEGDRCSHSSSTVAGPWTLLTNTGTSSGKRSRAGCSLVLLWNAFKILWKKDFTRSLYVVFLCHWPKIEIKRWCPSTNRHTLNPICPLYK